MVFLRKKERNNFFGVDRRKFMERWQSGRMQLTANELTWETGSLGSNPSLSVHALIQL